MNENQLKESLEKYIAKLRTPKEIRRALALLQGKPNEEAIKLLEKAKNQIASHKIPYMKFGKDGIDFAYDYIGQAITLLSDKSCECGGSGEVYDPHECGGRETGDMVPCPRGCQPKEPKPLPIGHLDRPKTDPFRHSPVHPHKTAQCQPKEPKPRPDGPNIDCPKCKRKEAMYWDGRAKIYICPYVKCNHVIRITCEDCKIDHPACKDSKKLCSAFTPKPSCSECGGSGEVPTPPDQTGSFYVRCSKCQPKEPKPAAGEIAKKIREKTLQLQLYDSSDSRSPDITYTEVFKLCDYIEQLERKIKGMETVLNGEGRGYCIGLEAECDNLNEQIVELKAEIELKDKC